jgi:hypothetical protein
MIVKAANGEIVSKSFSAAENRIAVRRGFRGVGGAVIAAGAGPVLDNDRLAHRLRHVLEHDAADDVAGAAAGKRDDRGDRPGRIVLRLDTIADDDDC